VWLRFGCPAVTEPPFTVKSPNGKMSVGTNGCVVYRTVTANFS
jgi:hypothetical protein